MSETPQFDLQMPTWTPGSYLQREFERNVQDFNADDSGHPLNWDKVSKATWRITTGTGPAEPKTIRATNPVYANERTTQTWQNRGSAINAKRAPHPILSKYSMLLRTWWNR